ncbi:MAG: hypothetical protein VB085_08895 [Peptococcaceae bacterium]|nr:hypothetical protein [Peptococcaceae bacterium]
MEFFTNCVFAGSEIREIDKDGKHYRFVTARLLDGETGRMLEVNVGEDEEKFLSVPKFVPVKVIVKAAQTKRGLRLYLRGMVIADA